MSQDLSGQRGAFAPEWSGTAYAQFDTNVSNSLRLVGNVVLSYKGEFFLDGDLDPNLNRDAYTKVDARIGLASLSDSWELALYGRNLADEKTYTFGVDSPLSAGIFAAWIEEPRTYGILLRYNF